MHNTDTTTIIPNHSSKDAKLTIATTNVTVAAVHETIDAFLHSFPVCWCQQVSDVYPSTKMDGISSATTASAVEILTTPFGSDQNKVIWGDAYVT